MLIPAFRIITSVYDFVIYTLNFFLKINLIGKVWFEFAVTSDITR